MEKNKKKKLTKKQLTDFEAKGKAVETAIQRLIANHQSSGEISANDVLVSGGVLFEGKKSSAISNTIMLCTGNRATIIPNSVIKLKIPIDVNDFQDIPDFPADLPDAFAILILDGKKMNSDFCYMGLGNNNNDQSHVTCQSVQLQTGVFAANGTNSGTPTIELQKGKVFTE